MGYFESLLFLCCGAALLIDSVAVFAKNKSIPGLLVRLLVGVACVFLALYSLIVSTDGAWVYVSKNALLGFGLIVYAISGLYSPPSPKFPNWTKWATLIFGVGFVFLSIAEIFWL